MAERTLNNPLSGGEVIEAILDKVREKLRSDCHLNPNSAYDWFTAEIEIHLDMHDAGAHIKGDYKTEAKQGTQPTEEKTLQHVEADFYIDPAPPNEVRVDTGQPVPTLTRDEHGKDVIKGVRYARKDAKKAVKAVAILLLCVGMGRAQTKPAPATGEPALTQTEQIAIMTISQKNRETHELQQQVLEAMRAVEADIARAHPGYHFDEKTGHLVPDVKAKK